MNYADTIYRMVAERTESLAMASFAGEIADVCLADPSGVSDALVEWISRVSHMSYGQMRKFSNFNDSELARVFVAPSKLDPLPVASTYFGMGRAMFERLEVKEQHIVDSIASEFVRIIPRQLITEEEIAFKDFVQIAITACLTSADSLNNHWAFFTIPFLGYGLSDGGESKFMVSQVMLMRTREEAEDLGLLDD